MKSTVETSGPETLPVPTGTTPEPAQQVEAPPLLDPEFSAWLEELL